MLLLLAASGMAVAGTAWGRPPAASPGGDGGGLEAALARRAAFLRAELEAARSRQLYLVLVHDAPDDASRAVGGAAEGGAASGESAAAGAGAKGTVASSTATDGGAALGATGGAEERGAAIVGRLEVRAEGMTLLAIPVQQAEWIKGGGASKIGDGSRAGDASRSEGSGDDGSGRAGGEAGGKGLGEPTAADREGRDEAGGRASRWPALAYRLTGPPPELVRPVLAPPGAEGTTARAPSPPSRAAAPGAPLDFRARQRRELLDRAPARYRLVFAAGEGGPLLEVAVDGDGTATGESVRDRWHRLAARFGGAPVPARLRLVLEEDAARRLALVIQPETRLLIGPGARSP